MLHAVIMAGGSGTRFWPESRQAQPKQLLQLAGPRTMLQSTVDRLGSLVEPQHTWIVTSVQLADRVAAQLPQLPRSQIIGEPCRRDTAPCVGLAALLVSRDDSEATMLVMPADHVIRPDDVFQSSIRLAAALVREQSRRIATFGIRPTYPAATFGYVERGAPLDAPTQAKNPGPSGKAPAVYQVRTFREKPTVDVARQYVESGNFYWNSGIFVWQAATILDELKRREPEMIQRLERIVAAHGGADFHRLFEREFAQIRAISIDYAVMEHATNVVVIDAPFEWDDVGSWQALARLHGADAQGNTIAAKHLGVNTRGTIVRGPDNHLIVTLGLDDCVVVHTADVTLVANKHDEEAVRQINMLLQELGWEEYL